MQDIPRTFPLQPIVGQVTCVVKNNEKAPVRVSLLQSSHSVSVPACVQGTQFDTYWRLRLPAHSPNYVVLPVTPYFSDSVARLPCIENVVTRQDAAYCVHMHFATVRLASRHVWRRTERLLLLASFGLDQPHDLTRLPPEPNVMCRDLASPLSSKS